MIDDDKLPETLALFVRFVRLNPQLAETDPALLRVWRAYYAEAERTALR